MDRLICIHGHFYQPPRENPWIEEVERQDSAYPYHDWNERITAECYAPNAAARIMGEKEKILDIVNSYSRISFNFGPTLLSWMEKKAPEVYQSILAADKLSQANFSGHGSALAQVYNHMIMPLANRRDKETQVVWGIRDFEYRFGRKPEGMWLSETAVDLETLEVLAENDIAFTILAAHQAKQVRKTGETNWEDVAGSRVDPRRPYMCHLPSGKKIILFFYDNPAAHDVAFGPLLKNGEDFSKRLTGLFSEHSDQPAQLVNIATDGETYGHHHRYGDMALAYCLDYIESRHQAKITIYGEYLDKYAVTHEAEIFENTSWSCFHGIERWRSNCGCNSGLAPGSSQAWREPLRKALDGLRNDLILVFEKNLQPYINQPWQARNDYIDVILNRSEIKIESFLEKHCRRQLSHSDKVTILRLLEMQRNALLMFTSCGWFFDDISGIETIQVMQYAARAMQLAQEVAGVDLQKYFSDTLEKALSNNAAYKNGKVIWEEFIQPAIADLHKASAHFAVSTLMDDFQAKNTIYSYTGGWEIYDHEEQGGQQLITGRMRVQSDVTMEMNNVVFAILHLGEHTLLAGIQDEISDEKFSDMRNELMTSFQKGELTKMVRLMDERFAPYTYTLWDLFKDEQRRILNMIMQSVIDETETYFRHIYEHHYPVIQLMNKKQIALPKILSTTVEFILNTDLIKLLECDPVDIDQLYKLVDEIERWNFKRDKETLEFVVSQTITRLMRRFSEDANNLVGLGTLETTLVILRPLKLSMDVWQAQNLYHGIDREYYSVMLQKAEAKDAAALKWIALFDRVGNELRVHRNGNMF
ncbi:DUF3536 domain-containing protein [bacterium]|nr:DUF3536 domain-containing protein [bacterium]